MAYMFSFEKLNVWIDVKTLVKHVYLVTKGFPNEEKIGLTSQLRSALVS